ncbi:MAG: ubiquinone/menaquinone biosynthesis methyltransferase [Chloroflexi bacterium]|nr:ubiquinone/menaquinone biosynthesis methyltransferase [Chloroflexota bacterium]
MPSAVQKIFSEIPSTYELVNHVLTLGLDIAWRRKAARLAAVPGNRDEARLLDVCTGTGETAVYLRRWAKHAEVVAVDFTERMLRTARAKEGARGIRLVMADAQRLPFADNSFDAVTISFATRNLNRDRENLLACLREFKRVLKQGGTLVNLETSQPLSRRVRRVYHCYVRLLVKPVGARISGSEAGYAYLSHTIPLFYDAEELASVVRQAGFTAVTYQRLLFGIAAIHMATK